MAAEIEDILKLNIVLVGVNLLREERQRKSFQDEVNAELVLTPNLVVTISSGMQQSSGHIIQLPKDRISIESDPSRTLINKDYPVHKRHSNETDLPRLVEVIDACMKSGGGEDAEITSFGFNISLVFRQDSGKTAFSYIAEKLFSFQLPGNENHPPLGGSGKIAFQLPEYRSTMTIEPRMNDASTQKVFLEINRHFENRNYPSGHNLLQEFESVWEEAESIVARIDENA